MIIMLMKISVHWENEREPTFVNSSTSAQLLTLARINRLTLFKQLHSVGIVAWGVPTSWICTRNLSKLAHSDGLIRTPPYLHHSPTAAKQLLSTTFWPATTAKRLPSSKTSLVSKLAALIRNADPGWASWNLSRWGVVLLPAFHLFFISFKSLQGRSE